MTCCPVREKPYFGEAVQDDENTEHPHLIQLPDSHFNRLQDSKEKKNHSTSRIQNTAEACQTTPIWPPNDLELSNKLHF